MKKLTFLSFFVAVLGLMTCVAGLSSCHEGSRTSNGSEQVDTLLDKETLSMVLSAIAKGDLEHTMSLIDSLQNADRLPSAKADYYRAQIHYNCGKYAEAAEYRQKVVDACAESGLYPELYGRAAATLANYLEVNDRYEDALRVLVPAITRLKDDPDISSVVKVVMLATIGDCQLALNRVDEGAQNYEMAYQYMKRYQREKYTLNDFKSCISMAYSISVAYHSLNMQDEIMKWTERADSLLAWYEKLPGADADFADYRHGEIYLTEAEILTKQGKTAEAAKAYEQFMQTVYAKTDDGRIGSVSYLSLNKRYAEAADIYKDYDRLAAEWELEPSLEVIADYLFPKFRMNYLAGRKDSALAVAVNIDQIYGHALEEKNNSDAAELATIYETQQKEARIARQQAELSEQRMWAAAIIFSLITIFFVIYTLVRRRAAKRLAEMRAVQERIESELRIARDIQMSMVPSQFPDYEGLDMYASMTPAKEVGGDLYGYVLFGDKLYFVVGDVSGKGVPASLFMAQATRLFRTMATQGMMPAEICSRMNDALSGDDNENGMFVTLFLGLIDLKTGHMDFCNAGHNPPVIDGEFLKMQPNVPIGLLPGIVFEGEEIDTVKGRQLFIYTDGLNEAENKRQEQFGDDHLLDILRSTHPDSARQVVETLAAKVAEHRNGAEPNDDLTMMCLMVR